MGNTLNHDTNMLCITCTDKGQALGDKLSAELSDCLSVEVCRVGRPESLAELTCRGFRDYKALLYIGATGIAVRAIAPHLVNKAEDPAVICMDELGTFAISLVSGHLGGANNLTRLLASKAKSIPVITTATDLNGRFAVDEWCKHQNCKLMERQRIKLVSSAVLKGEQVTVYAPFPIAGQSPAYVKQGPAESADVILDYRLQEQEQADALHLVPKILFLGVGCRRGIAEEAVEALWEKVKEENGILEEAIVCAATIDLKKDETGLLAFAKKHGWKLNIFTSEELQAVPGDYTESAFVKSITGVSNVCERSAMASGGKELILRKTALNGVTMAIAVADYQPDWTWKEELNQEEI